MRVGGCERGCWHGRCWADFAGGVTSSSGSPIRPTTPYRKRMGFMIADGRSIAREDINVALVRRLIAAQFPQWADLPIRPVALDGWDNRTFHLGDDMSVRLPSAQWYVAQVEKEHRWLPRLAPLLPLPIPVPLARGVPGAGYPWPWSVYRWLDGEAATV